MPRGIERGSGRRGASKGPARVITILLLLEILGLLTAIIVFRPLPRPVSSAFIVAITLTAALRLLVPFMTSFRAYRREDGERHRRRLEEERRAGLESGETVLESDPEARRRYMRFPRGLFLLGCPGLLAVSLLGLYLTKPYMGMAWADMLRSALTGASALAGAAFLPLLIYWADCSGTTLVQRIYLPSQGGLRYTGYSGSMEQREEFSFTLMTLASFSVSKRSLRMRGWFYKETRDIHGRGAKEVYKSLWIPRTFSEDREQELIKALEAMGDRPAAIASSGRHSGDSDSE